MAKPVRHEEFALADRSLAVGYTMSGGGKTPVRVAIRWWRGRGPNARASATWGRMLVGRTYTMAGWRRQLAEILEDWE